MKLVKATLIVIALASTMGQPVVARGHGGHGGHGHVSVGVFVGGPVFWPGYYYGPPYYYPPYYPPNYPPVVAAPYSPATYVEQGGVPPAPAPSQANWWYHCADAKAYYPYVRECPGGWQRVAPQPVN